MPRLAGGDQRIVRGLGVVGVDRAELDREFLAGEIAEILDVVLVVLGHHRRQRRGAVGDHDHLRGALGRVEHEGVDHVEPAVLQARDHGRELHALESHLEAEPLRDGVAEIGIEADDLAVIVHVLNRRHRRIDGGDQRALPHQRRMPELRLARGLRRVHGHSQRHEAPANPRSSKLSSLLISAPSVAILW